MNRMANSAIANHAAAWPRTNGDPLCCLSHDSTHSMRIPSGGAATGEERRPDWVIARCTALLDTSMGNERVLAKNFKWLAAPCLAVEPFASLSQVTLRRAYARRAQRSTSSRKSRTT